MMPFWQNQIVNPGIMCFFHITFVVIDHEIMSTAILSFPLSQEGKLPVTDQSQYAHTVLVNYLGGLS